MDPNNYICVLIENVCQMNEFDDQLKCILMTYIISIRTKNNLGNYFIFYSGVNYRLTEFAQSTIMIAGFVMTRPWHSDVLHTPCHDADGRHGHISDTI